MSSTVFLVRHGNRIDFRNDAWESPYPKDPHLAPDGVTQARQTGRRLRGEGIEAIYASPFWRTMETAQLIADEVGLPVEIEPGASEWLNPAWFAEAPLLRPVAEAALAFPRVRVGDRPVVLPAWPETEERALAREGAAIRALVGRHAGPVLVVGHGHSLIGMARGLVPGAQVVHALCAVVRLDRDAAGWRMTLDGDTSHLDGGAEAGHRLA